MTLIVDAPRPRPFSFLSFLKEELTLRPSRIAAMARIAGSCAAVVAIAMLYQIPLPAYMAYVVFLISRNEAASTLLTGVVAAIALTLAVGLSLLFYVLDASEPALRLPLMAGATFIGMFLSRTMTLGPVAFLAGFVLVLSQTVIDEVPNLEVLTRLVLWLWVVAIVPDTLTILVNLVIGESPSRLARRKAIELLADLAMALRSGDFEPLRQAQTEAVELLELRHRAGMFNHDLRSRTGIDTLLIETLAELLALCSLLPASTPIEARLPLAKASDEIAAAFAQDKAPAPGPCGPAETVLLGLSPEARPVVVAMIETLTRLRDGVAARQSAKEPVVAGAAKSPFVPDAFSNRDHVHFALKTTIAVMAAYIIYSGLDWPGISTAVTTCFFVALGSLGETVHKLTLRISGALIGGLVGGLCIVYVLPLMEDIGQLCLLIAAVSFVCAWIATSSERLSYAGLQIAFAFYLGVLQGYAPATDLTVLRDRVVGILLGNFLIALVFSTLWPASAADRARSSLAAALRTLGQLLSKGGRIEAGARLTAIKALSDARRFVSLAAFELRLLAASSWSGGGAEWSIESLDHLAAAVFTVVDQQAHPQSAELDGMDAALSFWFMAQADQFAKGQRISAPEGRSVLQRLLTALPDEPPLSLRVAIEARLLLQSEIANAVAISA